MSNLTAKFLTYRQSGAKRIPKPIEPTESAHKPKHWRNKPLYPLHGWLSNDETKEQRQDRLLKALQDGYALSYPEWRWLSSRGGSWRSLIAGNATKKHTIKDYFRAEYLFNHSAPVYRG